MALSAASLILIPTEFEASQCRTELSSIARTGAMVQICGFGPVVSAARSMQWIASQRPREVVLLGIAGALDERLQVGKAYDFSEVVCYGVGVGSGELHQSAASLGWEQWPVQPADTVLSGVEASDDALPLSQATHVQRQLLTCCSASANVAEAKCKLAAHPCAVAEDMEGYAVAIACRLAQVPLRIIRGISNRAGQRDSAQWQVQSAMSAAAELLMQDLST
ncbi:MAG: futalosine hydrolase [Pirellulaceae bacterium]